MKHYNGWTIINLGGHVEMKRYHAQKDKLWHWAFLLRDCKAFCDKRDAGETIPNLYLHPLYC